MNTKLIIFDVGGTISDFGCLAVLNAFKKLFDKNDYSIPTEVIKKYTGLSKKEHLIKICQECSKYSGYSDLSNKIDFLYEKLTPIIIESVEEHSILIDGVLDVIEYLRSNNIKIATSTGYFKEASNTANKKMEEQGFKADYSICSDDVPFGRPAPWMIFDIMKNLNIQSVENVIKVGDTLVDILAGRNAGVRAIGVKKSSSLLGLTKASWFSLGIGDKDFYYTKVSNELSKGRPFAIISSIIELLKFV